MSLEKDIKKMLVESHDMAEREGWTDQHHRHHRMANDHDMLANNYRSDTEDGIALSKYHNKKAMLHRMVANALGDLLDHTSR